MATIFKTLVGTIASGNTSIVFTDENINNDSLIDVYFSNSEIDYNISQVNNSVTVEIEKQSSVTGVALFINNSDSVDYPITAQDVSYFDTSVYYELLEHKSELNSLTTAIGILGTNKQDTLTPGTNITIEDNVISASGGGANVKTESIMLSSSTVEGVSQFTIPSTINTPLLVTIDYNWRCLLFNDNGVWKFSCHYKNNYNQILGGTYEFTIVYIE